MATIADYVNARGSFVLINLPLIEHRVTIETLYNRFPYSYVPDRFVSRARYLIGTWRKHMSRYVTWPQIQKNIFYLPLQNNDMFMYHMNRLSGGWSRLTTDVTDSWEEHTGEAQDSLIDYMRTTWQRSSIHDECTLGEYVEAGLQAIKAAQSNGPRIHPLKYTYFLFTPSSHTEPQSTGYVGVSAMLWRWLQAATEALKADVLQKLKVYEGRVDRYAACTLTEWRRLAYQHGYYQDAFIGYMPSLKLVGRTEAAEILLELDQEFRDHYASVEIQGRLKSRDALVKVLRKVPVYAKRFKHVMAEHVDLHRLVENG